MDVGRGYLNSTTQVFSSRDQISGLILNPTLTEFILSNESQIVIP